jgi:hypothetical protein
MSESMAFIGGVAVAGLAALLLLKGSGNAQPNFNVTPQVQQAPAIAPPMPQPGVYPGVPMYPNQFPPSQDTTELRTQLERQKNQLDALQRENDQLRNQTQQFQSQIQTYYQSQLNAQQNQNSAQQTALGPQDAWWSSNIMWAVGGIALTVGGGIVVAGVSALFSQKDRPTRTVQVIHPYNGSGHTISPPVRRAEFLPPRSERRMEAPEYDDTY